MALSDQGTELKNQNKLQYGDPCAKPAWDRTMSSCQAQGSNLALMVLQKYGIPVIGSIPSNSYSSCCPLDILNQDPLTCIKMSLSAKLLDGEYWECFADEQGFARFQKVLDGSSASQDFFTLKNVQYCLPTAQVQSLADMVVVRAADPPAFRQCGDWMEIINGGNGSIVRIADLAGQNLFNRPLTTRPGVGGTGVSSNTNSAPPVMGTKFTWGEVSSQGVNVGDDPTCDHGIFSQHGGIIYPDYERKQGYKDGINDLFEIGPHMQILFWLVDTDFGQNNDPHYLRFYNVQFQKASEFPVMLDVSPTNYTADIVDAFGPNCHTGPGNTPEQIIIDLREPEDSESCESVQKASEESKNSPHIGWSEYSIPSLYGYGKASSQINFADISKWDVGSNLCFENQVDNMYESTSSMLGNGASLMGYEKFKPHHIIIGPTTPIFIGVQKESQTFDIPNTNYVEIPSKSSVSDGILTYALKAQAPHCGTYCTMDSFGYRSTGIGPDASVCWGDQVGWMNPWWNLMLTEVSHSWPSGLSSMSHYINYNWIVNELKLKRPGKLMGIGGEGMFTVNQWWAKVNISRPGLIVQGKGKNVESFLQDIRVRVMPVYIVDMPPPVAACGNTGFDQVVNPDTDVWDNMYCTVENKKGDSDKLQEASTGITVDLTFPYLFPSYTSGGDLGSLRNSFDEIGRMCHTVAKNLFGYFDSFRNEPNRSMSFICGPPRSQAEIPFLGQTINAPSMGARTINSISFQYTDSSVYNMTVEVGPITINQVAAGGLRPKKQRNEDVDGRVVSHEHGALFKVRVQGIGVINAWNANPWPWEVGDKVKVQLYNNPIEL
jgi:hypothetical protein